MKAVEAIKKLEKEFKENENSHVFLLEFFYKLLIKGAEDIFRTIKFLFINYLRDEWKHTPTVSGPQCPPIVGFTT